MNAEPLKPVACDGCQVAEPRVKEYAPPNARKPGLTVLAGSRTRPRRIPLIVPITILAASLCALTRGEEPSARPLRVRAQLSSGPYYVGQSILLQISAIAHDQRPSVIPPRIVGAEVTPLGDDLEPISASGIGNLIVENNRFISRYRVLARRPGILKVPAISVRLGDRSGASGPIRISIEKLPEWGRPGSFLGGVGSFELTAEASPARVRVGQVLEYRLRVTGTAALGMTQTPKLRPLPQLGPGLRIEPAPVEAVSEPPSRVFRFRLRPTQPGKLVIPPVAIAAFDPKIRRYMTKVSPSVPVQVVDVPRFDPSQLEYVPPPLGDSIWPRFAVATGLGTVLLAVSAGIWLRLRRSTREQRSRLAARRLLRRLLRSVDRSLSPSEAARRLTEGLAEYLHVVRARPRGVLTPEEAREGVASAMCDDELGERAGRLVAHCDRAQYSLGGPSTEVLLEEARGLFDALDQVGAERRGR